MSDLREVTQEERDAMTADGVFDVNGNMPFHPGYTGIHRLSDGGFVQRRTDDYGTPQWVANQRSVTDKDDIAAIENHLRGSDESSIAPPQDACKPPDVAATADNLRAMTEPPTCVTCKWYSQRRAEHLCNHPDLRLFSAVTGHGPSFAGLNRRYPKESCGQEGLFWTPSGDFDQEALDNRRQRIEDERDAASKLPTPDTTMLYPKKGPRPFTKGSFGESEPFPTLTFTIVFGVVAVVLCIAIQIAVMVAVPRIKNNTLFVDPRLPSPITAPLNPNQSER